MRLPFLTRPPARVAPSLSAYGFVEVRGGTSRVKCIPALAGRLVEMEMAGRQWLLHNESVPFTPPVEGGSWAETADSGGFDECFPTVAPCRVPGWVRGWGGMDLPEHGELWSQVPEMQVDTGPDGQAVVTTWEGRKLPYRLTRLVRVTREGAVVMTYHAVNDAADRIPFIWAAHPLLPFTPDTKLVLPEASPFRVTAAHGIDMGDGRSQHRWPFVRAGGRVLDLLTPHAMARDYACKLFVQPTHGWARMQQGGLELEVSFDLREVPYVGLWINRGGWGPSRKSRYTNLSIKPGIGAPDTLSDALGDWKSAQWLEPGEVKTWSTTWRARPVPDENGNGHHPA